MVTLRLVILGGFVAQAGDRRVLLPTRKAEALLAYLALQRGCPVRRDALAKLLWTTSGTEHARNNLRQALAAIRAALGQAATAIVTDRDAVRLEGNWIQADAPEFERIATSDQVPELRTAVDLYRGELLAGFEGLHARAFVDWRAREAARLRALAVFAMRSLLAHEEAAAVCGEEAETLARRLLDLDPTQEIAHRTLMRRYSEMGQTTLSMQQYDRCCEALQRLGSTPSPETLRLREDLLTGKPPKAVPATALNSPVHGHADRPLPKRPSIAVLPFTNTSGDPDQEYFVDGITEEITVALSRIRSFLVIARNSAFTYKGHAVDVRQVGRELGVRYLLEGSARRSGNRIRITAQLVEVETGSSIWAERFEATSDDVFDLQDHITDAVAGAIEPSLRRAEIERARMKATANLDAYDLYLQALPQLYKLTEDGSQQALALLGRAVELDPAYARAKALAAMLHGLRFSSWWGEDRIEKREAVRLAWEALQDGQDDAEALRAAGWAIAYVAREYEVGLASLDRALLLSAGGSAPILTSSGLVRCYALDWRTAVDHLHRAIRLSPVDPEMALMFVGLSNAHFIGKEYEEAERWARRSIQLRPQLPVAHRFLVTTLANAGRLDEAKAACSILRGLLPSRYSLSSNIMRLDDQHTEVVGRFLGGLRQAGVPE
jgi:TolB-like protein/DNA-binding SARP family transcriptional activator